MTDLKFTDLVEPVAVDQKTALRVTVLGGEVLVRQWPIWPPVMAVTP